MSHRYSDDQLAGVLRRLAQDEPTLGRRTYDARRRADDPHHHTFEARFGSWGSALAFAGLTATCQPFDLAGTAPSWTSAELINCLRMYREQTGSSTIARYRTWRAQADDLVHIPTADAIRYRFGSWGAALNAAFPLPVSGTAQPPLVTH